MQYWSEKTCPDECSDKSECLKYSEEFIFNLTTLWIQTQNKSFVDISFPYSKDQKPISYYEKRECKRFGMEYSIQILTRAYFSWKYFIWMLKNCENAKNMLVNNHQNQEEYKGNSIYRKITVFRNIVAHSRNMHTRTHAHTDILKSKVNKWNSKTNRNKEIEKKNAKPMNIA